MSHLFLREWRGEVSKKFKKIPETIDLVARGRISSLATRPKFPFCVRAAKTLKVNRTPVLTVTGKAFWGTPGTRQKINQTGEKASRVRCLGNPISRWK
jgi:hypothetical protein